MLFVDNQNVTAPQTNLALEEHLLRNLDLEEPLLLFYINEPAVIVGRNQNTLEEIDFEYVRENDIHVVRRLSGGGAVYHDLGNLNFSFITRGRGDLHNFAKFTDPVVGVLNDLGVAAELRGKSDLFVGERKISGNAQFSTSRRMFSHGTLLFDTNLEKMLRALNPGRRQIESKAVQSIRQYVANIRDHLPEGMSIAALRLALLEGIFEGEEIREYALTDADWETVEGLRKERYETWEWNFGKSPQFDQQKRERLPAGIVDVRINVDHGRIQEMVIFGDFSGARSVQELADHLAGVRHEPEALRNALAKVNLNDFFGVMDEDTFVSLLY